MAWTEDKAFEDQQIKGSLQQGKAVSLLSRVDILPEYLLSWVECQPERQGARWLRARAVRAAWERAGKTRPYHLTALILARTSDPAAGRK